MFGEYQCASKDFSDTTGIKVYDDWGMVNQALIQRVFLDSYQTHDEAFVESFFEEYKAELPEPIKPLDKYHAVMGIISQYNRDDIEFFMRVDTFERTKEYKTWCNDLERRLQLHMFWIPSPKTLLKIEKDLALGKFQPRVLAERYHQYG
jgi:hypothetical protein